MKKIGLLLTAILVFQGCATAERIEDPKIGTWAYYSQNDENLGFVYLNTNDEAVTPKDEEKRYYATSGFVEDIAFVAKCNSYDEDGACELTSIAMMGMDGKLLNNFGEFNYPQLLVSHEYPAAVLHVDLKDIRSMFPLWHGRSDEGAELTKDTIFFENRMIVEQNGLYGFVDHTGQAVIAPRFLAASNFQNGKATVITDSGFGTVDLFGQYYNDQYACMTPYDEQYTLVNAGGTLVNYAMDLRNGSGLYVSKSLQKAHKARPDADQLCINGKWGLINSENLTVVPPEFDTIIFEEGTRYIQVRDTAQNVMGFYETDGKRIVPAQYPLVYAGDSFFIAQNADGKYALIDKTGQLRTEFIYDGFVSKNREDNTGMYLLSEAATMIKDGKYGVVLPNGTESVPFEYEELTAESEGLVGFRKGNRWGVLNIKNVETHSPIYGSIGLFEDGRATATLAGDEIYIYRDDNARNAWIEKSRINEIKANEADRIAAEEARQQQLAIEQQRLEEERKQTQMLTEAEITKLRKEISELSGRIEVLQPQYELTKSEGMRQDLERLKAERASLEARLQTLLQINP